MAIDRDQPVATTPLTPLGYHDSTSHFGSSRSNNPDTNPIEFNKATPLTNSISDNTQDHTKSLNDENECRRNSYTYTSNPFYDKSPSSEITNKIPLSMRFMHKPSRSGELFKQANDPTRRNSLFNSQIKQELKFLPENHINTAHIDDVMDDNSDTHSSPSTGSPHENYNLVRKKSGEILKSSLKDSSYFDKKRSKSLPTTPTYKQVHFGGDNLVKYFKKKDRPTAISASNSPTLDGTDPLDLNRLSLDSDESENDGVYDSTDEPEDEFEYINDEVNTNHNLLSKAAITSYPNPHHGRLINWNLELPNFKEVSYHEKINIHQKPVFLERIFLTVDKKYLLGHIAVRNLSYEKSITVRYTLDGWNTIIEIPTIYVPDIPSILKINNYDRFIFKISVESLFNSFRSGQRFNSNDRKQDNLYNLCIRYNIPGNEFWDNNENLNYLIKLTKTISTNAKDEENKQPHLPGTNLTRPANPSTKIQDHSKKPKYSSSYLKRRVSESDLKNKDAANKDGSFNGNKIYRHDNESSDFNDFIKNNYYLSSPLLSSYNDRDDELTTSINSFTPQSNFSPDTNSHTPKMKPEASKINFNVGAPEDDVPETKQKFNSSSFSLNSFNKNYLDNKSYKELLDSYCFFTTPKHKLSSESNTSYSPDDNSRAAYFDFNNSSSYSKNYGARNGKRNDDGRNIHTVSSFLGNPQ